MPSAFLYRFYVTVSLFLFIAFFRQFYRLILVGASLLERAGIPTVQVMSNIVAVAALGEASHHTCRVRYAMASLTGRDRFVFVFVTGDAVDTFMLGIGLAVQFEGFLVARCTHLVGGIGRIRYRSRHMRLVTALAVAGGHVGAVRFVALGTQWNFAVRVVAEAASQCGVLALDLLQLDDLLGVAGKALVSDIIGQLDNFWCMRIVVATQTGGKVVVRLTAMALAACRDNFLYRRRMTGMTILAAHLGFVGAAIGGNSIRCCRVTLDAIRVAQGRLRISRSGSQCRHPHQCCRQSDNFQHGYQLLHLLPSCFHVM